jgi:hypothetical protein
MVHPEVERVAEEIAIMETRGAATIADAAAGALAVEARKFDGDDPAAFRARLPDILPRVKPWGSRPRAGQSTAGGSPLVRGGVVGRASPAPDRESRLHLPPRGVRIRTSDSALQSPNVDRINVPPAVGFIPRVTSCLLRISSPSPKQMFQTLSNPICNRKIEARSDPGDDLGGRGLLNVVHGISKIVP